MRRTGVTIVLFCSVLAMPCTEALADDGQVYSGQQRRDTTIAASQSTTGTFGNSSVVSVPELDGTRLTAQECEDQGIAPEECQAQMRAGSRATRISPFSAQTGTVGTARTANKVFEELATSAGVAFADAMFNINGASAQALAFGAEYAVAASQLEIEAATANDQLVPQDDMQREQQRAMVLECVARLRTQDETLTTGQAYDRCMDPQGVYALSEDEGTVSDGTGLIDPGQSDMADDPNNPAEQMCLSNVAFAAEANMQQQAQQTNDPALEREAEVRRQIREDFLLVCGDICYTYDTSEANFGLLGMKIKPQPSSYDGAYGEGVGGLVRQFTMEAYENILTLLHGRCSCHNEAANINVKDWDPFDPDKQVCPNNGESGTGRSTNNITFWGSPSKAEAIALASFNEWSFIGVGECLWKDYTTSFEASDDSSGTPVSSTATDADVIQCGALEPGGPNGYDALFAPNNNGTGQPGQPNPNIAPFFARLHYLAQGLAYERLIRTKNEVLRYAQRFAATMNNDGLRTGMKNLCEQAVSADNENEWSSYLTTVNMVLQNLKDQCDIGRAGGSPVSGSTMSDGTGSVMPTGNS